jgi:precorrin-6B methylase 2
VRIAKPAKYLQTVSIPEGTAGNFSIKKLNITEDQVRMHNLRCMINNEMERQLTPGIYTQLCEKTRIWMSDTPAEQLDHSEFVLKAHGHILITGLGIGMVAAACLRKPEVKSIIVIERQPEVIQLVAPTLQKMAEVAGKPLQIIEADALKWKPNQKFDLAWHDIWPDICADNAESMDQIIEWYCTHVHEEQSCWCENQVRELAEQDALMERLRHKTRNRLHSAETEINGIKL